MKSQRLKEGKSLQVRTEKGLDVRLFNDSIEAELKMMPFGVNIEIVDLQSRMGLLAPPGAYYRITFYKPGKITGVIGHVIEVKNILPGVIYLSAEGVEIRGCTHNPSGTNKASINYKER